MNAWLTYYLQFFLSMMPILAVLIPLVIWQSRRLSRSLKNQEKALDLQRETVALLKESLKRQEDLYSVLSTKKP